MTTTCMRWIVGFGLGAFCAASSLTAQSIQAIKAEVESLRANDVAWREIPWNSCLIDGLAESHATGKPVILWIFIDRPIDDARC